MEISVRDQIYFSILAASHQAYCPLGLNQETVSFSPSTIKLFARIFLLDIGKEEEEMKKLMIEWKDSPWFCEFYWSTDAKHLILRVMKSRVPPTLKSIHQSFTSLNLHDKGVKFDTCHGKAETLF